MDISRALLTDKVAIVTGAGRGIGKGVALAFADFGAKVVIAERRGAWAEQTERSIHERGRIALAVPTDVRDGKQVKAMVERAVQEFGGVDIMVNNVGGIFLGRDRPPLEPFIEMSEDAWDDSYALNLKSAYFCTSEAARVMVRAGHGGSIINVASSEAFRGAPGFAPYSAYKGGLINLTRSLALELAPYSIRVNCIAPDSIDTEGMARAIPEGEAPPRYEIPLGRTASPEEAAGVFIFLACDLSSYVTGATIPVEGGLLAAGGWMRHPTKGWTPSPVAFAEGT
jgi:NAD(P)-dependent dehydrogenase (short-subunit alcohol dehydrogenase family)